MKGAAAEIRAHLSDGIIPFWLTHAEDREHGGFLTWHDENGRSIGTPEKFLNTQCRLLWWFSHLANSERARPEFKTIARSGFEFIRDRFWDPVHGGWYW
jgi:mannose/cellobiose epimerase-like protein (N-acyl-D-glucosamine 2-epimerase family)